MACCQRLYHAFTTVKKGLEYFIQIDFTAITWTEKGYERVQCSIL